MKKILLMVVSLYFLCGCGDQTQAKGESDSKYSNHIIVGATPVPAAEILEFAKPLLEKEGFSMQVQVFTDYVMPDIALNDKSNDANLYQHKPYLEAQNSQRGFNLVSLAPIYVVPLALYSKNYKSVAEIPEGADVALPGDSSNLARALILLHNNGVIKLKDPNNLASTIEYDILENPKKLRFKPVEASSLPSIYPSVDAAVINANYALQAKMSVKDSLFYEDDTSIYVNVLAAREDNQDNPAILKLQEILLSKEVSEFILEKYKGEIIPVKKK
ncbi:MetQ/NlpA family ABC transporter substrate-binding protein [Helicobacter canadensis]|uniref:Lipoprotein n=1 Tax=Helicobacter canadensis MIT 98-5491 TaxID=537970 RepID=C5ZWD9_9HELI|nr:MetQ/NlpA family ABC transporter substrate-binding protein [Helicobacter canadensis]EES89457.1 D-methionine-binding lipoprotein MetQ [Helicobacter canadensis MIT 98-5491]EFR48248.1 NLPA lipoprotein [Helicobacter canadensis MIT 98-5491]STO99495.1 ABC transporter substrate-binding protein [Helicobacter canadensis]